MPYSKVLKMQDSPSHENESTPRRQAGEDAEIGSMQLDKTTSTAPPSMGQGPTPDNELDSHIGLMASFNMVKEENGITAPVEISLQEAKSHQITEASVDRQVSFKT